MYYWGSQTAITPVLELMNVLFFFFFFCSFSFGEIIKVGDLVCMLFALYTENSLRRYVSFMHRLSHYD